MLAPSNADIDHATGTLLGTLWLLPAFVVVLSGIGALEAADGHLRTASMWGTIALGSAGVFGWAWRERREARRLVRWLVHHEADLHCGAPSGDEHALTIDRPLVQYEVLVSLVLFEIRMLTAPRLRTSPILPTVVTLLLGWWGLPWGPLHTVRVVAQNLRGGRSNSARQLLATASKRSPSSAPWWRRTLALDSGDAVEIAVNVAIAAIFAFIASMILFAIVRSSFHRPR